MTDDITDVGVKTNAGIGVGGVGGAAAASAAAIFIFCFHADNFSCGFFSVQQFNKPSLVEI